MMKSLFLSVFCGLIVAALAVSINPTPNQRVVLEHTVACVKDSSCMGHDWSPLAEPIARDQMIHIVFAVKQLNTDALAASCSDVSTPSSANYGNYLNLETLGDIHRNEEATLKVESFLRKHRVQHISTTRNGEYIIAHLTVGQAEQMLSVTFQTFASERVSHQIVRTTDAYSLPKAIAGAVDYVLNVNQFPQASTRPHYIRGMDVFGDGYNGDVTPQLISSFYQIPTNTISNSNITQSVFESGQYFSPTDLSSFQTKFSVPQIAITSIIGGNQPKACDQNYQTCFEASLDVQQITAIAQGAETTFWEIDGNGDPFTPWITAVANDASPPLVHSISYGSIESEIPSSQLTLFNNEAMKLCSRGVSIVVSSGDDGAMNYEACQAGECSINPSFPATSPYVTAVGATQGPEAGDPEIACQSNQGGLITTGGGFSVFYDQPSYQSDAISAYLNSGVDFPPSSDFNSANRGFPDVAMMGNRYPIVDGGQVLVGSGTSASAPVFAAALSLANDALRSAGSPSVGFVNPALYADNSIFNDITSGENNCCAGESGQYSCCKYGFAATTGWDATTGLGSVNVANLISSVTNNMAARRFN